MYSLVEGRFCRPIEGRGVFGLSGDGMAVPTLDLPVNSSCIVVRTFPNLEDGALDRLEVVCLVAGMAALECLECVRTMPKFLDPPSPYCPEQRNDRVLFKRPPNASTVFSSSRTITDQSTRPNLVLYLLHWGRIGVR